METPGFAENLNYREDRVKMDQDNREDIFDGSRYRTLSQPGGVLANVNNFSYGLNNDGFKITRTSNAEAQPIYVNINELPPSVRQKYIFLAGIWIHRSAPNMNYLLDTFVDQGNDLAINGLRWRRNGENVTSLFIDAYCTADAKAKALLLNLNEPTGFRSCMFCDIVGVQAAGCEFPTCLARKPRKIATFKKWRGSEFRNFLLYGLPCLTGLVRDDILDNLKRLADASFILCKQSISQEDLAQAEEDLLVFMYEYQDIFGVENMKFNVHVLSHLAEVVRSLGNLWVHSTFNFESWNHRLKR
ncbi:hypothetical protein FOCC_FOCC014007 [Frankliniella occidentalis]|nr:hypothetical protein FOCC_FOCC014007 [Frankliniella occidentalis]